MRRRSRPGITLLETLIAMFVALVGLSGLAALFWLGGVEMSEGAKLDRAVAVARAAQRTFKVLGMHRPIQSYTYTTGTTTSTGLTQTWVAPTGVTPPGGGGSFPSTNAWYVDGSAPTQPPVKSGTQPPAPMMPFSATPPTYLNGVASASAGTQIGVGNYSQGFAIDPIGVYANWSSTDPTHQHPAFPALDASGVSHGATPYNIQFPPSGSDTTPCLIRTTLMAYPQEPPVTGSPAAPTQITPTLVYMGSSTPGQTMSSGQIDLIFHSQDDLLLNPANGDYPPTQTYSSAGRRQSQGDYSWMATVTPGFSSYQSNITTANAPIVTPIGDTNMVRVSIVVFYKRIPIITPDATNTTPPSERMVQIATWSKAHATATNPAPVGPDGTINTGTLPTGVAGGEVQLVTAVAPSYLNLKAGQWIMLSQQPAQQQYNPNAGATMNANIKTYSTYWYRWYKVVATGSFGTNTATSPTTYYRNVTLQGPDWNPQAGISTAVTTPVPTYATICDGVVAVYEKDMELEQTGSAWAPN